MSGRMILAATVLTIISLVLFVAGFPAVRRRHFLAMAASLIVALVLLSLAGLFVTVSIGTRGYHSFSQGALAAVVEIAPTGPSSFNAVFRLPDGRETTFSFAGGELHLDAHVVTWTPLAGVLGLSPAYELNRVEGRFSPPPDAEGRPPAVFSLALEKPVNILELRQRVPLFGLLLDVKLGSATVAANQRAQFEVLVRTTGVVVRRIDEEYKPHENTRRTGGSVRLSHARGGAERRAAG